MRKKNYIVDRVNALFFAFFEQKTANYLKNKKFKLEKNFMADSKKMHATAMNKNLSSQKSTFTLFALLSTPR